MNVLLINPPRENEILGNNPAIIEEERGYNPPLGLLYIAGYLTGHPDHHVEIIDAQVEQLNYATLKSRVASSEFDIIGLTAMTMTILDVIKTIKLVKDLSKDTIVVLGGPHVNLFPTETINLDAVDYLVMGEGEKTFAELLDALSLKKDLNHIPGIVYRDNGEIITTGLRPHITDLDGLPFPARQLVPYKKYNSLLFEGEVATTIFTSRGCPFKCSFCDRPHLGKKFRARSAMNVVDEIADCVDLGIQDFLFYDDTFSVYKKRVIEICEEIIKRKLDIKWDIRARVDTIDREMLEWLKKAGCQGIHYGIESGSEKILKVLNKGITIKQAKHVFDMTRGLGIQTLAYFMIGNPQETYEDIQLTFKVIKMLNPDYVHMTILTPFPGTKIYFEGLEKGIIKKDYWREFAENPTADFVPPHWDENFSREQLKQLLVKGYSGFYMRPSYIIKRIMKLKNMKEFIKKAKAGIKVFKMRWQ